MLKTIVPMELNANGTRISNLPDWKLNSTGVLSGAHKLFTTKIKSRRLSSDQSQIFFLQDFIDSAKILIYLYNIYNRVPVSSSTLFMLKSY